MTALDRDRLEAGLRELIARLHQAGQLASVSLVGAAALALRYFDRRITTDIDARITHSHRPARYRPPATAGTRRPRTPRTVTQPH